MCDILLVEDNEHFRETLRDSLCARLPDADIREARTGEEAVEHCERLFPRVLLLDLGLPGMNGLQAMERIRSNNADVRIVVVTGNDSPEYQEAAQSKGANYFVSKNTVKLAELVALASALVDKTDPVDSVSDKFRMTARF